MMFCAIFANFSFSRNALCVTLNVFRRHDLKMSMTAIAGLDAGIPPSLDASGRTAFQKIRYGIIPRLTRG